MGPIRKSGYHRGVGMPKRAVISLITRICPKCETQGPIIYVTQNTEKAAIALE